ncbi:hypothetical protein [Acinetobacter larvae]|uniref:Uncharacterized protein n=1 Tax=Acinetobacter larvae TaxID=1789224 RepID=A0A1B2M2Q3_9GAMM|nr:hypothetical protein [Acinetobacter larvae]AOA59480.1 hypothetical protein BFG52_14745 [Acinetobacter larvae]
MVAGSQIIIDEQGVHLQTARIIRAHAAQHIFQKAIKINTELPILPNQQLDLPYSNKWDFYHLFYPLTFSTVHYKLINTKNQSFSTGQLDEHGRTARIHHAQAQQYNILVGPTQAWTVSIDDGDQEQTLSYVCSAHLSGRAHDE